MLYKLKVIIERDRKRKWFINEMILERERKRVLQVIDS